MRKPKTSYAEFQASYTDEQRKRDHEDAVRRGANGVRAFLSGFETAFGMRTALDRDEVLAALDDYDRRRFLVIERAIRWPSERPHVKRPDVTECYDKPVTVCYDCGNRFQTGRSDARYCSPACRQRAYRARRTPA